MIRRDVNTLIPFAVGLALLAAGLTQCASTRSTGWNGHASGQVGMASYIASSFDGKETASGEIYNPDEMTAAHRTLPFGTRVRVTNLSNGQEVVVRINDRGPFIEGRIIDLSRLAARKLRFIEEGVTKVRIEPIGR